MAPQDLRSLLTTARDDAPPPRLSVDDITSAGRRLVRRRRRVAMLSSVGGSAAAAIAAVTAVVMLNAAPQPVTPALDPSRLPPKASPVPTAFVEAAAFTTTYEGYGTARYSVGDPDLVTTAYQQSTIGFVAGAPSSPLAEPSPSTTTSAEGALPGPSGDRGGTLVVYRAGAFEPKLFEPAEKVRLRTAVGLLHYAGQQTAPSADRATIQKYAQAGQPIPTLTWQYADDSYAAIYWSAWETTPTRDELVAIADGLVPAAPKPFPIGFQAQLVPKGYGLAAASFGQDVRTGDRIVSAVRLTPKAIPLPITGPIDFDDHLTATLAVGVPTPDGKAGTGRVSCDSGAPTCTMVTDGGVLIMVEFSTTKDLAAFPPSLVARRMIPADPSDPRSWPAVTDVFGT